MTAKQELLAITARLERITQLVQLSPHRASSTRRQAEERTRLSSATRDAHRAVDRFFQRFEGLLPQPLVERWRQDCAIDLEQTEAVLIMLSSIASETEASLSDSDEEWGQAVERGFLHLQRSLSVDDSISATWNEAFKKGETELEKLGAQHLLLHGLFAFKAHSADARTDLVFGKPITPEVDRWRVRAGAPLVLTEWKKAASAAGAAEKLKQARVQLQIYRAGVVGALELSSRCYRILVSMKQIQCPETELLSNGRAVRTINIAIKPDSPSRAARAR